MTNDSMMSDDSKLSSKARLGALWGAGIFLVLWLGMLGTIGEVLLLGPGLWLPGSLGVKTPAESMIWRGIAAIVPAVVFAFTGYVCGPLFFAMFESVTKVTRVIVIVFLAVTLLMLIMIGRHLTT